MVELREGSAARQALAQAGFTPGDIECFLNGPRQQAASARA